MMNRMSRQDSGEQPFTLVVGAIRLRAYMAEDAEAIHALTWQPEIHAWLPGWNVSLEQRREWLENYEIPENGEFLRLASNGEDVGELRLRLAIMLEQTGELIGWCCTGPKEELPAPNREIMYAISKDHRGKGYATQAVQAVTGYLFAHANIEVLSAVALLANDASNKVLQKCGFVFMNVIEIDDEVYNYYMLVRGGVS